MASVARFEQSPTMQDGIGLAERYRPAAERLASLRALADRDRQRSLTTLIESEIIPRLMAAHATGAPRIAVREDTAAISPSDVEALAPLALQVEADAVLAHVEAILARGVTVDTVMVDLLAPTARLLGEWWESDRCDFVDVTMALWRLQQIVHEVAARAPAERQRGAGRLRALFASMPGDQHNFGTVVVDELFGRGGWSTERLDGAETPDLLRRAGEERFDLIGLTVSRDALIADLHSIIVALRSVSRNPRVCIMVGGRVFNADPQLAAAVGADGTASDAKLALKMASDLVRAREGDLVCS